MAEKKLTPAELRALTQFDPVNVTPVPSHDTPPASFGQNRAPTPQTLAAAAASPIPVIKPMASHGPAPAPNQALTKALDFVEQSQPHMPGDTGANSGQNLQDPYSLWMNLPGRSGPGAAPTLPQDVGPDYGPATPSDLHSGNAFSNLFGKMDAQDWLGAAGLGLGATGMFMNAANQKDQFNKQFGEEQRQFNVGATQLNPYKQQGDAAKLAMMRALAESGPAQAQLGSAQSLDPARAGVGAAANQYLSDDALTKSKADFDQKMALQNALQQQPAKKSGGGFWKTLGKIGAIAAPIIAAPFTGGASLALIGAGAGAASSALNGGGLKGALLGAGIGAIPGVGYAKSGVTAGLKPALTAGLKQAGKNMLTHPQQALALANALH